MTKLSWVVSQEVALPIASRCTSSKGVSLGKGVSSQSGDKQVKGTASFSSSCLRKGEVEAKTSW
jgi:hypothetical protein